MKKSKSLKYFITLFVFILTGLLAYYYFTPYFAPEQRVEQNFKIIFADVGQGDAIIVQSDDQTMLVDAGNNESAVKFVNYLRSLKISQFNTVVATHPHEDHIGGMDNVINSFEAARIIMPDVTTNTKTFESLLKAIQNKKIPVENPATGDNFKLGSALCTVLAPNRSHYEEINDYSIVLRIVFGNNSFLLMGDAGFESENEIAAKGYFFKSDVIKIGHHGSSSSTGDEFLKQAVPRYAVISVGQGNDYGHPHKETLARLNQGGIKIYRTDLNGNITVTSDGSKIDIITGK
jgi:competence protein ComEC